jgi:hypothetical protein
MDKKIRTTIGIVLFFIIAVMVIIAVKNKDEWFKNEATIEFPDGCVEKYVNGELVTDECTEARMLLEKQEEMQYNKQLIPQWKTT